MPNRPCTWPNCQNYREDAVTVGRPYFVGHCSVWWLLITTLIPFFGPHLYWNVAVERGRVELCGEHYRAFKAILSRHKR
jgi:hypothetical protein